MSDVLQVTSSIKLTVHSLAADLVDTFVIGGIVGMRLIWCINQTYVTCIVDKEAELFEVSRERRVRLHGVFYTPKHVDTASWKEMRFQMSWRDLRKNGTTELLGMASLLVACSGLYPLNMARANSKMSNPIST